VFGDVVECISGMLRIAGGLVVPVVIFGANKMIVGGHKLVAFNVARQSDANHILLIHTAARDKKLARTHSVSLPVGVGAHACAAHIEL